MVARTVSRPASKPLAERITPQTVSGRRARFHRARARPLRSRPPASRRLARTSTNNSLTRRTPSVERRSPSRVTLCANRVMRSCAAVGDRLLDSPRPSLRSFVRTATDPSVRRRTFPGSASSPDGASATCRRSGRRIIAVVEGYVSGALLIGSGAGATVPAAPHPATCASTPNTVPRWRSCPSSARTVSS